MGELGLFSMVVLIVAIVTFGKVYRSRFQAQINRPDGLGLAEAAQMKSEIHRLNERIQVLERLAIDPAKRLSDQIDALGSTPKRLDNH